MPTFPKDHIAYTGQQAISEICRPIMEKLNLSYFHYAKLNKNGTGVALYSRTDWADHFYGKGYKIRARLPDQNLSLGEASICLWEESDPKFGDMDERVISDARHFFNIKQPISIVFPYENHLESFVFGADASNSTPISTYFNNLNAIMQFIQEFKHQAAPVLKTAYESEVRFRAEIQAPELELLNNIPNSPKIFTGLTGEAELSEAEFKIIQRINLGMTAQEIGDHLFRSKRTIETHIDNIKGKLGCRKRSELAQILNQHQDLLLKSAL